MFIIFDSYGVQVVHNLSTYLSGNLCKQSVLRKTTKLSWPNYCQRWCIGRSGLSKLRLFHKLKRK